MTSSFSFRLSVLRRKRGTQSIPYEYSMIGSCSLSHAHCTQHTPAHTTPPPPPSYDTINRHHQSHYDSSIRPSVPPEPPSPLHLSGSMI